MLRKLLKILFIYQEKEVPFRMGSRTRFKELMRLIDEGFPTYQIELEKVDAKN